MFDPNVLFKILTLSAPFVFFGKLITIELGGRTFSRVAGVKDAPWIADDDLDESIEDALRKDVKEVLTDLQREVDAKMRQA